MINLALIEARFQNFCRFCNFPAREPINLQPFEQRWKQFRKVSESTRFFPPIFIAPRVDAIAHRLWEYVLSVWWSILEDLSLDREQRILKKKKKFERKLRDLDEFFFFFQFI